MVAFVAEPAVAPATRIWLAFACFIRLLFDGAFAARVLALRERPALEPDDEESPESDREPPDEPTPSARPAEAAPTSFDAALVLLSLLQREGRLVDFVEQDIDGFADDEIGAAARVLHAGCRKALRQHATIAPVRIEEEDSRVEVTAGVDTGEVKLVGAVAGKPPYRGVLRHRGWRITLSLPEAASGHDTSVVAPAEVEL